MAMMEAGGASTAQYDGRGSAGLRWCVFLLFFIFGGITSLNDVLIPKLKHMFVLSYAEAMMVQFVFFAAYLLISFPAAAILRRLGYMKTAAVGLLTMAAACLMFIPAAGSGLFVTFLAALFVLGAGITTVQVVANPMISMLGAPATAHSRLTFAQAFNSLGTTIFPFVGAKLILGSLNAVDPAALAPAARDAYFSAEIATVTRAYLFIAVALLLIAGVIWAGRHMLAEAKRDGGSAWPSFALLGRSRFAFGTLGIFVYVGAEVSIASLMTNYLMEPRTFGFAAQKAGEMLIFYWGGAMIGRFVGSALLRMLPPPVVLLCAALAAGGLVALSCIGSGPLAGVTLLAVGLFNSIMFPTIFTLACDGLSEAERADGSGLLCMAIVGGAVVPLMTGIAADAAGLTSALLIPLCCYAVIAAFAFYCRGRVAGKMA